MFSPITRACLTYGLPSIVRQVPTAQPQQRASQVGDWTFGSVSGSRLAGVNNA